MSNQDSTTGIKKQVMKFYDAVGWKHSADGKFEDTVRYEDLRPVSAEYRRNCNLRINQYLRSASTPSVPKKYILDIASGPLPIPEYLTYSQEHTYRICADLSLTALQEARAVLDGQARPEAKGHGLYVQCDITHLPFKSDAIDNIVSLHTLYHVPAQEQLNGFCELHRVLKPGATGVVVYKWSFYSILMNLLMPHMILWLAIQKIKNYLLPPKTNEPKLYFHVHSPWWFRKNLRPRMNYEIRVFRSLSTRFLKQYIHERLGGKTVLGWFQRLEEKYPRLLGMIGEYPTFIIKK